MGIKRFFEESRGVLRIRDFPAKTHLGEVAKRLSYAAHRFDSVPEATIDPEILCEMIRKSVSANTWSVHSARVLKEMIHPLAMDTCKFCDNGHALSQFLAYVSTTGNTRIFRFLFNYYFWRFDPQHTLSLMLGAFIRENVGKLGDSKMKIACVLFSVHDAKNGPIEVANEIFKRRSFSSVFDEIGVYLDAREKGFGEHVFCRVCRIVRQELAHSPNSSLVQFLISEALSKCNDIRDADVTYSRRPLVARALLKPWTQATPPNSVKLTTKVFFDDYYGNPSLEIEKWARISDTTKNVYRRWLNLDIVKVFFLINRRIVSHRHSSFQQWAAREQFWNERIINGDVLDCAMAYSKDGIRMINHLGYDIRYAELKGAARDHSVLLMNLRIDLNNGAQAHLVVADWNHDGSMRIWKRKNSRAPDVLDILHHSSSGRKIYHADKFRLFSDDSLRHSGNWQFRAFQAFHNLSRSE